MSELGQVAFEVLQETRPELKVCTEAELRRLSDLDRRQWRPTFSKAEYMRGQAAKEQAGAFEVSLYRKYNIDPFVYPLRVKVAPCYKCRKIAGCDCFYKAASVYYE